jgi:hypothetical protein
MTRRITSAAVAAATIAALLTRSVPVQMTEQTTANPLTVATSARSEPLTPRITPEPKDPAAECAGRIATDTGQGWSCKRKPNDLSSNH